MLPPPPGGGAVVWRECCHAAAASTASRKGGSLGRASRFSFSASRGRNPGCVRELVPTAPARHGSEQRSSLVLSPPPRVHGRPPNPRRRKTRLVRTCGSPPATKDPRGAPLVSLPATVLGRAHVRDSCRCSAQTSSRVNTHFVRTGKQRY